MCAITLDLQCFSKQFVITNVSYKQEETTLELQNHGKLTGEIHYGLLVM